MHPRLAHIIKTLAFALFITVPQLLFSQRAIVNTASGFYQLNATGPICNTTISYSYCNPNAQNNFLLSSALYKDTLSFVSRDGRLFKFKLGDTGSCIQVTTFPGNGNSTAMINSLVFSVDGFIYAADGQTKELFRFNPYTNVLTSLGILNATPSGDLIFYKRKLIMTATDGNIYEVNINNPGASTIYIPASSGRVFNGLIAVPFDCLKNKYYAFENVTGQELSHAYELDMENRVVMAQACDLAYAVYDGASNVDDGTTLGITIDSINITTPCGRNTTGSVRIRANSASSGMEYTLNNNNTNSTGVFTNLTPGVYALTVKNSRGCSKDTSFEIKYGINPDYSLEKWRATNCNTSDGKVIFHARTNYLPLEFSNNNGNWITDSAFINLPGGAQNIKIRDASGCVVDSNYVLGYNAPPDYIASIQTTPSFCSRKNGALQITPRTGFSAGSFSIGITSLPTIAGTIYNNLDAGTYLVRINYLQNCTIDTLVTIPLDRNPAPTINLQITHQTCLIDNGSIGIGLTGNFSPYTISLDGGAFSASMQYNNLAPGTHTLQIKDVDGCVTDTSKIINSYTLEHVVLDSSTVNPTCLEPTKGSILININGSRPAYQFKIASTNYANHTSVTGLSEGSYDAYIYNADGCLVDSLVHIVLESTLLPSCEVLSMPTGFTPNNDGLNDVFKPVGGSWLKTYQLSVYNRAGELVFHSTDRSIGWNGTCKGIPQTSGVYVWVIQYSTNYNPTIVTKKGTVVLVK
jgi:gliding motility-associated-like protein